MAQKKSKGGNSSKKKGPSPKGRKGGNKQPPKTDLDSKLVQQSQLNPQDRVAFVRPLWETLSTADRVELLTVNVDDVVARLKQQSQRSTQDLGLEYEESLEKIYHRGLSRLNEEGTWKVWQWNADEAPFTCAEKFKKESLETKLPVELRPLLPREEAKTTEKPAEAALRERMTALINNIHSQLQSAQEAWRRGQRAVAEPGEQTRDANIDLVISILDTLQHEHQCLYQTILTPVAEFICALIPAKNRKSTKTELFFEDLEKITPEDVARLYEWLTEKVDALCSRLKPDPKDEDIDEEEEAVGDIDLFSLTEDKKAFTVNAKWLEHLQDRKLSDEGQPRKVKPGEDEHKVGLVLEWVYGSIVSTAEKARDGAKRPLGDWNPTVDQAFHNLVDMLKDQAEWDSRAKSAKALLKDMMSIKKKMQSLSKQHNVDVPGTAAARESQTDCGDLPDAVIEGVLQREGLLTQAKLHLLKYERLLAKNQLKSIRTELMQGEPEFERLKRELENAKALVRSADKDRSRSAKVNDSLIEEQLEVQSAFREQGARLQGMYDKRQRTELEIARREQEIGQLETWHKSVTQLLGRLQNCVQEKKEGIEKVRATFHKDFKKQLYSDLDDQMFFNRIKTELKTVEKRVEDGAVVLQHLEMFLINVACDDPGAMIGTSVILPLLQERLDKKAMEYSMKRASEAMDALLKMEEETKAKKEMKRRSKTASQSEIRSMEVQDDTADESSQKESEEPVRAPEPETLGSNSMEDPLMVARSIEYEETVLKESEEEFQSVSNRRRSDRKKAQQAKKVQAHPKRHAANRPVEAKSTPSKKETPPTKSPLNRNKTVKIVADSPPRKPQRSFSAAESDSPEDSRKVVAWVKGSIPEAVKTSRSVVTTRSSLKSSHSEGSVNIPATPDASDVVDQTLTTVNSDNAAKPTEPAAFNGDGPQFFSMVQAMNSTEQEEDGDDVESISGRSGRSSDATTPEPVHVNIGPPLMPPPMGIPPPIGPFAPFHPGFYSPMGPMMGPDGVRFPLPFHPTLSQPSTSAPESATDEGSPTTSKPIGFPQYPFWAPWSGAPMPPYMPMMPYGQWYPPEGAENFERQVKKFELRPTAEEFIPQSMQKEDDGVEEEFEETEQEYREVEMSAESAVTVTQTIEQTC